MTTETRSQIAIIKTATSTENAKKMKNKQYKIGDTFCGFSIILWRENCQSISNACIRYLDEGAVRKIEVNRPFLAQSTREQKATLWHEVGHLRDKDFKIHVYMDNSNYRTKKEIVADKLSFKKGYVHERRLSLMNLLNRLLEKDYLSDNDLSMTVERLVALSKYVRENPI